MTTSIVVVGAGGAGRETLDVIRAINLNSAKPEYRVVGVVDEAPSQTNLERLRARDITYLGTEHQWFRRTESESVFFVVGIGDPWIREQIAVRLEGQQFRAANPLVHPRAVVGSESRIARGTVVCSGAQLSTNVTIAEHVHVNPGVIIGHDSTVDAYVSLNPGAVISGDVSIERGALVGAGAVVLQGLSVGAQSIVGAAACAVRDVAKRAIVKGVPAR